MLPSARSTEHSLEKGRCSPQPAVESTVLQRVDLRIGIRPRRGSGSDMPLRIAYAGHNGSLARYRSKPPRLAVLIRVAIGARKRSGPSQLGPIWIYEKSRAKFSTPLNVRRTKYLHLEPVFLQTSWDPTKGAMCIPSQLFRRKNVVPRGICRGRGPCFIPVSRIEI